MIFDDDDDDDDERALMNEKIVTNVIKSIG